jgi:ribonuclease E
MFAPAAEAQAVENTPQAVPMMAAVAPVTAPAMPTATTAPAPITAVVMPGLPQYQLNLEQLHSVAREAGMEWVQSDAVKVQAVQAALAATPKPIVLPRERKPVAVVDDGPLVLVETRRDLTALAMQMQQQQQ